MVKRGPVSKLTPEKLEAYRKYYREWARKNRANWTHEDWHNKYMKYREQNLERDKRRREQLKSRGLCTNCGKKPAFQGQTRCEKCRNKRREQENEKNKVQMRLIRVQALRVLSNGTLPLCVRCGCNVMDLLEINHKKLVHYRALGKARGNSTNYSILKGRLTSADVEITCKVCNSAHYAETKKRGTWTIVWNGETNAVVEETIRGDGLVTKDFKEFLKEATV